MQLYVQIDKHKQSSNDDSIACNDTTRRLRGDEQKIKSVSFADREKIPNGLPPPRSFASGSISGEREREREREREMMSGKELESREKLEGKRILMANEKERETKKKEKKESERRERVKDRKKKKKKKEK